MSVYTFTPIDVGTLRTNANGINDSGQIVGYYVEQRQEVINPLMPIPVTTTYNHGFLYNYRNIDDPNAGPLYASGRNGGTFATGINSSGEIVGYYSDLLSPAPFPDHGFLYSNGSYTTLDDPLASPGVGTVPRGINSSGQIVGYYSGSDGRGHGFLYNPNGGGTYATLDDPLADFTQAFGINDAGQIVGTYTGADGTHGFLYNSNDGTYVTLDDPLVSDPFYGGTSAYGINNSGQIVGTYRAGNTGTEVFLYSGGYYTTLSELAGLSPAGINDMGQIVGSYHGSDGRDHGFLATPGPNLAPPPSTTADMILRRVDGTYEIYDIGNNAMLAGYSLGTVGTDWGFVTLGGFFDGDTSDMLLRNSNTGGFWVYDISNNNITGSAFLGNVGLNWQVMGLRQFQ